MKHMSYVFMGLFSDPIWYRAQGGIYGPAEVRFYTLCDKWFIRLDNWTQYVISFVLIVGE